MKNRFIIPIIVFAALLSVYSSCKKKDAGDGTIPVIVVLGSNPIYWAMDTPYVDDGATAYDITVDDDTINITNRIIVSNNVDVNTVGNYIVTYNVTDESGVSAEEKLRSVTVVLGK